MSLPLVLVPLGLGLVVALVLLVHHRRRTEAGTARAGSTADDLVSALVVELAVTPEAVKHRRRARPARPAAAAPAPVAPATPVAPLTPAATPASGPAAPTPPAAPSTSASEVWSERRSPYASSPAGKHRIALPDDDADLDIRWRPVEQSVGTAHGTATPLARATQVSITGRIQVGDAEEVVSWQPQPGDDRW